MKLDERDVILSCEAMHAIANIRCPMAMTHLRPADFPQLRKIAWHLTPDSTISGKEALALYERNWHLVDQARLTPGERELIDRLVKEFGNGILHV